MGSFVGADSAGANTAALTAASGAAITWPATDPGDIALLPWSFQNTQTPTDPTSDAFSLLADNADGSARLRCLYRYCDGAESGDVTGWLTSGINRQTAVLIVFRGYQFISGFSVRLETVTGNTHDNPAITSANGFGGNTPADGDTIVIITCTRDGATTVVTPPAGYQKRSEFGLAASGGTHTGVADDGLDDAVVLPHDPAAWTGFGASSGNAVTMTIALRPVSTGTTHSATGDRTATASLTGTGVGSKFAAGVAAATSVLTGAASAVKSALGSLAAAVTATGAATIARAGGGNRQAVATVTGAAVGTKLGAASLAALATVAGAADVITGELTAEGNRTTVAARAGAAQVTRTLTGDETAIATLTGASVLARLADGHVGAVAALDGTAQLTITPTGAVSVTATVQGEAQVAEPFTAAAETVASIRVTRTTATIRPGGTAAIHPTVTTATIRSTA